MALFNNIPYKCMHLASKVNFTKFFSKKYKCVRLITRLYGSRLEMAIVQPALATVRSNICSQSYSLVCPAYVHYLTNFIKHAT